MRLFKWTMVSCLILVGMNVFADVKDTATGASFPEEVIFEHNDGCFALQATGVSTRKKFFINIYSVAHYVQADAAAADDLLQAIFSNDKAKQLTFKWERTVEAVKVQLGYEESFKHVLSVSEYEQISDEIAQFIGYFHEEVKKGEEHVFRWIPEGRVEVIIKGNLVGSIDNLAFAKGLWSVWLGDRSVVERDKLISLIK